MSTLQKNIVLCGFMGSGKSTVGKLLAESLAVPFTDMDAYIEAREGSAIPEIFKQFGEDGFREREHAAVLVLAEQSGGVIAAGGGALLFERNVATLRKNGLIVFLDASFNDCYNRISSSDRPLVKSNTRESLEQIYISRRPRYLAVSDLILTNMSGAEEAVEKIKEAAFL